MSAHSHGLNGHTHSFTPQGSVGTHHHYYTPKGSIPGFVLGVVARWRGYEDPDLNHPDSGVTTTRLYNDGDFGGGGGAGGHYDKIKYEPIFTGTREYTEATKPTFTGIAGNTGGNSSQTTSVTSTGSFSGRADDTGTSGSNSSINIMPPYIVKYCWERIA